MMEPSKLWPILIFLFAVHKSESTFFNCTKQWKAIGDLSFRLSGRSMEFPCESTKELYRESGKYVPKNILATRMQIFKYEVVVALPRYKVGVPITLGMTQLKCKGCHTNIIPFPDWSYQQEGNCDAIQSAIDVYMDKNYVLWVLDDGIIDSLGAPYRKCPPKVLAISMLTKKVMKSIDLSSYVTSQSSLQYVVAENVLGDDHIYVSDASGAIITVNTHCGKGRRLVFPPSVMGVYSRNCPLYMNILMKDYCYYLYFTFADSDKIFAVDTSTLRDDDGLGAIEIIGKKSRGSNLVFCGTDGLSGLLFREKNGKEIYIWDCNTPWKKDEWRLAQRGGPERQVTHIAPGPWKLLWVLESNVHDFISNKAGSFGASTILHPMAKDIDETPILSLANLIKL